MSERTSGRRIAEPSRGSGPVLNPVLVVGLVAVLVAALALAGMKASDESTPEAVHEARYRPLTSQAISCPAGQGSNSELVAGSIGDEGEGEGEVVARSSGSGSSRPVEVPIGDVDRVRLPSSATVLHGSGTRAPGLVGARLSRSGVPASAECVAPQAETWFNGAGAGGLHESTLLLVNPDRGPAVADVTLWTTTGEVDAPTLRGVTVPGGETTEIDLAEVAPTREELSVRVTVTRGRIASTMSDTYTPRGAAKRTDGLPASSAPGQTQWIAGMPRTTSESVLVLVNPGTDASRVTLSVVGKETEFRPEGFEEIRVPAGQVVVQELPRSVTRLLADEDATIKLSATKPVTGGLRVVANRDFTHLPSAVAVDGDSIGLLPASGERTLTITGAGGSGSAQVTFLGVSGEDASTSVRVRPKATASVKVPRGATAVLVASKGAAVGAVRITTARGISVVPLRELVTEKVIPDVRPEW